MAVGSMTCVQIGLALSVPLFGQLGPLGTVWLRLAWASVILLVAVRPRPWRFRRPILLAAQKDARVAEPGPDDIYAVGTLGVVLGDVLVGLVDLGHDILLCRYYYDTTDVRGAYLYPIRCQEAA